MEDPVCRTLIPARQAITWTNNGKILYFCSAECRSQFITSQGDQPMKFFIDTANIFEIKQAVEMGMVDGVTTNPSSDRQGRPKI